MKPIVLASSSPYRRELLKKLHLDFTCDSPDIDESPLQDEDADALVQRLAKNKAAAIQNRHTNALIIGSDQVATLEGKILGKPGNRDKAIEQLQFSSGKTVTFRTGLALLNTATEQIQWTCELYQVTFRQLSRTAIEHYIDREQPFNCAGSFKSEGYGITLFEQLSGRDPNSLIGLPLIALIDMLKVEGVDLP